MHFDSIAVGTSSGHGLLLEIHRAVFEAKKNGDSCLSKYLLNKFGIEYQAIITAGKKLHTHRGEIEQTGRRGRKNNTKVKIYWIVLMKIVTKSWDL